MSLLGLVGHYHQFIKGFSKIARPLYAYLEGNGTNKKKKSCSLSLQVKEAFRYLKSVLMKAPVLIFADYSNPFSLETDASKDGLGRVLLQKGSDGKYHLMAYVSKALTKSEKNYHSSKLEVLALKWAIMEHFCEYLQYSVEPSLVQTDNNPLTYILTTPNLDATGHRWVGALADFNFNIEYLKGCDNSATDILSQMTQQLDNDVIKCLLDGLTMGTSNKAELHNPLMQQADFEDNVHVSTARPSMNTGPKGEINVVDWAQTQKEDPELDIAIRWIKTDCTSSLRTELGDITNSKEGLALTSRQKHLVIINSNLYVRATPPGDANETMLCVVRRAHKRKAIDSCHCDAGHQRQNCTLSLAAERFWWPGMSAEV